MISKNQLRYNEGKTDWTLIDFPCMEPIVRVLEYGAHKYSVFESTSAKDFGLKIKGSEITKEESDARISDNTLKIISSGRDNWKLGGSTKMLAASLFRHLISFLSGEDNDKESGCSHLGHIGCNVMFLLYNAKHYALKDDRR